MDMKELLGEYRICCNRLTERIDELNQRLLVRVSHTEYKELADRRRVLREERLELLRAMRSLQEYRH